MIILSLFSFKSDMSHLFVLLIYLHLQYLFQIVPADKDEDDQDGNLEYISRVEEEDDKESDQTMPGHGHVATGRGRTSSALRRTPGHGSNRAAVCAPAAQTAPAPAAASSNPTMSDLEDAFLDGLSLSTPFSSKWVLPTRVLSTQFIEGSKRFIIDCLSLTCTGAR